WLRCAHRSVAAGSAPAGPRTDAPSRPATSRRALRPRGRRAARRRTPGRPERSPESPLATSGVRAVEGSLPTELALDLTRAVLGGPFRPPQSVNAPVSPLRSALASRTPDTGGS